MQWTESTIGTCCDVLDNFRIPLNSEEREKRIGDIPYYGANGIQGYVDDFIFDEDLILLAEDGGNFEQYSSRPIAYRITGKSWVNNHAHVLRAKNGFDQNFIFYSLVHKNILPFIVGGTRSKLNQTELKTISVLIPDSSEEQAQIAAILSTIDQAIEQTEAIIEKQKRIKIALMQDLLTRGIDEHGNIRSEETHQFKGSPLGRIPVEWEVRTLGGCVKEKITYGIVQAGPNIEDGVPYIRTGDMSGDQLTEVALLRTSKAIAQAYKRSEVHSGDIVFALRATVGKVLLVPQCLDGANLTQGTAKISPGEEIYNGFLLWMLRSDRVKEQIRLVQKGTTFVEITLSDLADILIPVAQCIKEQSRIATILEAVEEQLMAESAGKAKLERLRTGLLQDLLTGTVRVTSLLSQSSEPPEGAAYGLRR